MAKPLTPEGPGGAIQIRPQATPVDTFIRPVSPGGSALGQLASALSSVAPELRQFGAAVSQREAETAAAQGEAFAADMAESKGAWAGLVKDGKVAPGQNPHFVLAAKQKFGEVAASKFQIALNDALTKLGDAPTPAQFEQAIGDTRAAFLKENAGAAANDLAFMSGFNGQAERMIDGARRAFAAQHAKMFEETATRAFAQSLHQKSQAALSQGADAVAAAINADTTEWLTVNPGKGNLGEKSMAEVKAQVLFSLMRSTGNPELVKQIAAKVTSGDGVMADDPLWFTNVDQVAQEVTNVQRNNEAEERRRENEAQAKATDEAKDAIHSLWVSGRTVDVSTVVASLKASGVDNPETTAIAILNQMPDADPRFYVSFRSRIYRGSLPNIADLDAAAQNHQISSSQYSQLVTEMEQANAAQRAAVAAGAPTTAAVWSHPAMRLLEDRIMGAVKTKTKVDPFTGKFLSYTAFTEDDAQQAISDAKQYLAGWLGQNWNSHSDGRLAAQEAEKVWRSFARAHNIVDDTEAKQGNSVMPADPSVETEITDNRLKMNMSSITLPELQAFRRMLGRFATMTPEQRTNYMKLPGAQAIYNALGRPDANTIGERLSKAESFLMTGSLTPPAKSK